MAVAVEAALFEDKGSGMSLDVLHARLFTAQSALMCVAYGLRVLRESASADQLISRQQAASYT
jgi:hypothetical protein